MNTTTCRLDDINTTLRAFYPFFMSLWHSNLTRNSQLYLKSLQLPAPSPSPALLKYTNADL